MKIKPLILLTVLVLLVTGGLWAQEKYEYAALAYVYGGGSPKDVKICISKPGGYEEVKAKIEEGTVVSNLTPTLIPLEKLNAEGWEVYSTGYTDYRTMYFLRKKKN